jgi:hypothetical protein
MRITGLQFHNREDVVGAVYIEVVRRLARDLQASGHRMPLADRHVRFGEERIR